MADLTLRGRLVGLETTDSGFRLAFKMIPALATRLQDIDLMHGLLNRNFDRGIDCGLDMSLTVTVPEETLEDVKKRRWQDYHPEDQC